MKVANPNEYVCYAKNDYVQITSHCLERLQIEPQSVDYASVQVIQNQVRQISTPLAFMEFFVAVYTWERDGNHEDVIQLVQDALLSMVLPEYRAELTQELCASSVAQTPRCSVMGQGPE